MSLAGGAAVILRDVDMPNGLDVPRDAANGVLLLDVGVERVVHHAETRVVHPLGMCGGIVDRIEEVTLEPVQIFYGQLDAGLLGIVGHLSMDLCGPLFFFWRRPLAAEDAQRLIKRPAEHFGPSASQQSTTRVR